MLYLKHNECASASRVVGIVYVYTHVHPRVLSAAALWCIRKEVILGHSDAVRYGTL